MGNEYAVLDRAPAADRLDSQATVSLCNGGTLPYAQVLNVTERAAPQASTAEIMIRNIDSDDQDANDITLQNPSGPLSPQSIPGGTRMAIRTDGDVFFIGEVLKRDEMGAAGALKLTLYNDQSLLARLPVYGCLCWDLDDLETPRPKFIPRLPIRFNPFGFGNCREENVSGASWPVPFFTRIAYQRAEMDAEVGMPTFWTPERVLRHLWYRLTVYDWAAGIYAHVPRIDGLKIEWPADSLTSFSDEMKKKLPDLNRRSWSVSKLLTTLCELSGIYGWATIPYSDSVSQIVLFPRIPPGGTSDQPTQTPPGGITLDLQRDGTPSDLSTIHDFHLTDDYEETLTQICAEGAPIEIECELSFGNDDEDLDTLEKGWSPAHEAHFIGMIVGDGTYAKGAGDIDKAILGRLLDGTKDDKLMVRAGSVAAIAMAQAALPTVFRAFRIKKGDPFDVIMNGYDDLLADFADHLLKSPRPLAGDDQVQRLYDGDEATDIVYQVKIQVSDTPVGDEEEETYHTVNVNPGLRVTPDGLIWLDGLGTALDGTDTATDCIYYGCLQVAPEDVLMKRIKINGVILHDARIHSAKGLYDDLDPNRIAREIDPSWMDKGFGPAGHAVAADVDKPDGFRWQHQVNSSPMDAETIDEVAKPFNREYRTDQADLDAFAERTLKEKARIARAATWSLIGIRPDLRAGTWIEAVNLRGGGGGLRRVRAAVIQVQWKFDGRQETVIALEGF
jgi:hypothetical protein